MPTSSFLTVLQSYGCEDMDLTMERFMMDEEFYYDILQQMVNDDSFTVLGRALDEGNARTAFNAAHTLKGVISNCGVTPLYRIVVQIVEPLRAGNCSGMMPLYAQLIAERDKFAEVLQSTHP